MALSVAWGERVETKVAFSEFLAGKHTVADRFMLQFANVYTGPILTVHGSRL